MPAVLGAMKEQVYWPLPSSARAVRMVTHLDVDDDAIQQVEHALSLVRTDTQPDALTRYW